MSDDARVDQRWIFWGSLREWDRRHTLVVDAALAAGLFLASTGWVLHVGVPHPDLGFVAALTLPLVVRRREPLPVFFVLAAVALCQWLVTGPLLADAALLVALYTVAADCSALSTAVAFVVLEVGVVMSTLRWTPLGDTLESIVFLSGMAFAAMLAGIVVRELRSQLEWLAERGDRLEVERDQQASLAAAAERARIAREMHDVISHNVQVMVTLADAAAVAQRQDPDRAREAMHEVSETGRQALNDMRRMLGLLREGTDGALSTARRESPKVSPAPGGPPGAGDTFGGALAPQPGVDELPALMDRVGSTGLVVRLEESGVPFDLSQAAGVTVFRIVQEALTNALKHAGDPSQVVVRLCFDDPDITVEVTDDGAVPAPGGEAGATGGGHGILGMRERAAAFGGTLVAGPRPGGGWQIRATLQGRKVTASQ